MTQKQAELERYFRRLWLKQELEATGQHSSDSSNSAPQQIESSARSVDTIPPTLVNTRRSAVEAAYHQLLKRWWTIAGAGPAADSAEAEAVHQQLIRTADEVGEPRATTLRREWANEWFARRGTCPLCGIPGESHAPDA